MRAKLLGVYGLLGLPLENSGCNRYKSSEASELPEHQARVASEALPAVSSLLGFIMPCLPALFL